MAGAGYRIQIDDKEVRQAFAALMSAGKDLSKPMDEIGSAMVASTIHRFETESGPDGQRWLPSPRALAEGGKPLTDRAHLRNSITHTADGDSVSWGTNLVYAAIHQLGGRAGRNRSVDLPARPFLGVDAGDETEIREILRDHIEGALP